MPASEIEFETLVKYIESGNVEKFKQSLLAVDDDEVDELLNDFEVDAGNTLLTLAIELKREEIATFLLEDRYSNVLVKDLRGVKYPLKDCPNDAGSTPLQMANDSGQTEISELLKAKGAKASQAQEASEEKKEEVVKDQIAEEQPKQTQSSNQEQKAKAKIIEEFLSSFDYAEKNSDVRSLGSQEKLDELSQYKNMGEMKSSTDVKSVKVTLALSIKKILKTLKDNTEIGVADTLIRMNELINLSNKRSENVRSYREDTGGKFEIDTQTGEKSYAPNFLQLIRPEGDFEKQLRKMQEFVIQEMAKQLIMEHVENTQGHPLSLNSKLNELATSETATPEQARYYNSLNTKLHDKLNDAYKDQKHDIDETVKKLKSKIKDMIERGYLPPSKNLDQQFYPFQLPRDMFGGNTEAVIVKEKGKDLGVFKKNANSNDQRIHILDDQIDKSFNMKNPHDKHRVDSFLKLAKEYNAALEIQAALTKDGNKEIDSTKTTDLAKHMVAAAKCTRKYEKEKVFVAEDSRWNKICKVARMIYNGELTFKRMKNHFNDKLNLFKAVPNKIYGPVQNITRDHNIEKTLDGPKRK